MNLDNLQSPKRSARVAAFVQPITHARERGLTWTQIVQEIGQSVGIDPQAKGAADRLRLAFNAAVTQIKKGRLKPATQPPTAAVTVRRETSISPNVDRGEATAPIERKGFKRINLD